MSLHNCEVTAGLKNSVNSDTSLLQGLSSVVNLNLIFEPHVNLDANKTTVRDFSGLYGYMIPVRNSHFQEI